MPARHENPGIDWSKFWAGGTPEDPCTCPTSWPDGVARVERGTRGPHHEKACPLYDAES